MRLSILASTSLALAILALILIKFTVVQVYAIPSSILIFLSFIGFAITMLAVAHSTEKILESTVIKTIDLPNDSVKLIKKNGHLKEVTINSESYTHIECNTDNPTKLTLYKNIVEEQWKSMKFLKHEKYVVVIE